jgi:ubiquinone/menaquinone biosynthesis C-methylase UbiE
MDSQKITTESYNNTVKDYIKFTEGLHQFTESNKFVSYLPKKSNILDLGCAYGRDAAIFIKKGHKVIGIDLSRNMIKAAKARVPKAKFYVMDIRKLKFNDDYFGGVWGSKVYLHVPKKDILRSLKEIYRVIKPGGIFYLSVKRGKGEKVLPDKRYKGINKFWSFFLKNEIEQEILKAGFKIVRSKVKKERVSYDTNQDIEIFCRK